MTVKRRKRHKFSTKSKGDFWFDGDAADEWIWFIQNLCRHVKGEWYGQPLKLAEWQAEADREERNFLDDLRPAASLLESPMAGGGA